MDYEWIEKTILKKIRSKNKKKKQKKINVKMPHAIKKPLARNENSIQNIAGRLPENSRNRFVDRQSKKNSKKDRPKKFVFFIEGWSVIFWLKIGISYCCLY